MRQRAFICLILAIATPGCKSWGKFWLTELSYATSPLLLTQSVAMTPVSPTMPGSARSCSASPNLPAGLALGDDCTISGTPTRGQGTLTYRITADLGSDTISGELRIRVLFQPRFVYVANSGAGNIVSIFTINSSTGQLTAAGTATSTSGPKFVLSDRNSAYLYVANHGSASVGVFSINPSSGALTQISGSPFAASANPYSLALDPEGKFLFVGHEGVQHVRVYSVDQTTGALANISGSPFLVGVGSTTPVSVNLDPTGKFLYVGDSQSVTTNARAFSVNQSSGAIIEIPGSPFGTINDAISVCVHPSGKFVYYAQYFAPTGAVAFTRDLTTGALTLMAGSPFSAGLAPGYVTTDVNGQFAYVANSGDAAGTAGLSAYTVNSTTGALVQVPGSPYSTGGNPIGAAVDETVRFVYTANGGGNNVSGYAISSSTGQLTATPGSPYAAGTSPFSVTIAGSNP